MITKLKSGTGNKSVFAATVNKKANLFQQKIEDQTRKDYVEGKATKTWKTTGHSGGYVSNNYTNIHNIPSILLFAYYYYTSIYPTIINNNNNHNYNRYRMANEGKYQPGVVKSGTKFSQPPPPKKSINDLK